MRPKRDALHEACRLKVFAARGHDWEDWRERKGRGGHLQQADLHRARQEGSAGAVLVVVRLVPGYQEKLDIIKDLNGVFHPGRLTALMGPSGSGKTTLMDILAGRKSGAGKIQGEVQLGTCDSRFHDLEALWGLPSSGGRADARRHRLAHLQICSVLSFSPSC